MYPVFFHYRRLMIPLSVIYFPDDIIVHYFSLVMSGVATIIMLGYAKPF